MLQLYFPCYFIVVLNIAHIFQVLMQVSVIEFVYEQLENELVSTGKKCHFGYLWFVKPHGHSDICQSDISHKLQMTLSLHAPSICNKVTYDTFPSDAEDQIIGQSVFEISSYSLHCVRCHLGKECHMPLSS